MFMPTTRFSLVENPSPPPTFLPTVTFKSDITAIYTDYLFDSLTRNKRRVCLCVFNEIH